MAVGFGCSHCSRGETEEQPISCVVLDGGPCLACNERANIRHKIKQLEDEIVILEAKYHALGSPMNAIHDPFIHKLPPEIGSHIFRQCLPRFDYSDLDLWEVREEWAVPLKLGAVCRKWRQLAWATPDLWMALCFTIQPSTKPSLAEWLPGLIHEWLRRSGLLPLTILFDHLGCSDRIDFSSSGHEFSHDPTVSALEVATDSVIEAMNLHSGRLRNLYLDVGADILRRPFAGPMQPNQLFSLNLANNSPLSSGVQLTPQFRIQSRPNPTYLKLSNLPLTSIDIGWNNITHAKLDLLNTNDCVELLRRAPRLQHFSLRRPLNRASFNSNTSILHPRLRVLKLSYDGTIILEAINLPSLEEWTLNLGDRIAIPLAIMLSLLERSSCHLKVLNLEMVVGYKEDLRPLLQAIPSLECLRLSFLYIYEGVLDDILTRIFLLDPNGNDISVADDNSKPFLPQLQHMECVADPSCIERFSPLPWDRIPQLYHDGHRRSLALKSAAIESDIKDETAFQLLQLIDEGVDLQIHDETMGGDFLENFRRMREKV